MPDRAVIEPLDEASALEHARHLEAGGDVYAALSTLTRSNREHPSERLEQELLRLRTEGFDQIPRPVGRNSWPRSCADPFPEVRGVPPEVDGRDLDADLMAGAIGHHGSLIVRDLVSPDDVAELRAAIRSAFEARAAVAAGAEPNGWYTPFEAGQHHAFGSERFVRIIDSPATLFRMLEIYERIGLVDIITEHLGERPALSAHKCALRRLTPNPDERSSDYHQDGSFLGKGIRTVNVWLPLSDCGGDDSTTAGLDVIPTRVDGILDTGTEGAFFDWTISETVVERAAGGASVVRPVFAAGDAMVFDEVMVHRTGLSAGMVDERMAIESWFFAPSVYPDDHVPLLV